MPDNNKPLFSRSVLAIVMLLCTLAIWALHSTAPSNKLPSPNIETWQTASNIPVVWLKQDDWQNGDKLEIRFTFQSPSLLAKAENNKLVQTTLAMLMSDSLPLSTASINQRLAPLAARANSYYDHENQSIGLTLSNQPQYLIPSLSLITNWLVQPDFKQRTFNAWQRQQKNTPSIQHNLEYVLFPTFTSAKNTQAMKNLSLAQVSKFYQDLQASAGTIFVVGDLSTEAKQVVKTSLNAISQNYQLSQSLTESDLNTLTSSVVRTNEGQYLWQTKSAIALTPVSSIKEWLSLQIWGADLVSTLNQQENIDFVQLAMTLPQQQPWVSWNIQYANHLIEKTQNDGSSNIMDAISFTSIEKVPSANNDTAFEQLFNSFKEQLEQQVQSPTWWSYIATQVTHENGQLTIEEFVNGYKEAVDTFTMNDYQMALNHLLKPLSYQEIQVYQ